MKKLRAKAKPGNRLAIKGRCTRFEKLIRALELGLPGESLCYACK